MEDRWVIGLYTNQMGAGNIIENNIKSTTTSLWDKVPTIEPKAWLDFDLNKYQKPFANLAVAVGVIALAQTTLGLAKAGLAMAAKSSRKIPTAKQLH